ncbi:MAG: putative flap endonuclease-1-like 5' DNA nuclease [Oleiphilaceae bacterium]|jgi:predicted flap endonuclease-1-like 5' DNA nuclease
MVTSASKKTEKIAKNKPEKNSLLKNLKGKLKGSRKELMSQVAELSNDVVQFKNENSSKKIIKKLEKKYQKQISKLQSEFNEQLENLHVMQSKLIEHLPKEVVGKLNLSTPTKAPALKKTLQKKVAVASQKTKSALASIKGVGPATLKKLEDAGFTSLEELADTPESKAEALKTFEKVKGFETWAQQAKDLLAKK